MIKKVLILISLFMLNSCIYMRYYGAGVFKEPIKYEYPKLPNNPDNTNEPKYATVMIDKSEKLVFGYLGDCGGSTFLLGIVLPIIPFYESNTCEKNGFSIDSKNNDFKNINYQLKYNNTTYNPFPNKTNVFPIPNFKEFKKAKDKTLIIHKKIDNGALITKEIPFDWKIVVHSVVVP